MDSQFLTSVVSPIFPKSVSNRLVKLPVINMESDPNRNVTRSDLSGELGFVPAPRKTDLTLVVTRPGAGPTSTMVTRSRVWEGRGMNIDPKVEVRPETETRQEMQILAEIPITCEGGFGPTRSSFSDTDSQYLTADRPETTAAFTPSLAKPTNNQDPSSHTNLSTSWSGTAQNLSI